jgi:hypothetical protein
MTYLPLLFGVIALLTYVLSNKWNISHRKYAQKIVSISAAVSITYILLEFFPLFTESALAINKLLYITVLIGFIIHHLIEKNIYQHHLKTNELKRLLSVEENTFSFIYHIIVGILLVAFTQEHVVQGLLYFIPSIAFIFVSTLPTNPHPSGWKALFLGSSTMIGILFATFIWTSRPLWLQTALIGFALGVMLFTVIRHHIPFGSKGKIGYFTLGFLVYALLIMGSWYI